MNFFRNKISILARGEIATYTKSHEWREGFDIEKPFDLLSRIRTVVVNPGEVVIVQ